LTGPDLKGVPFTIGRIGSPGATPRGTAEIVPAKNIESAHKNTVDGQTPLIIV
jgi:hypothetical protein